MKHYLWLVGHFVMTKKYKLSNFLSRYDQWIIFEKNADVIPIVTGDNWQVNIISNSFPLSLK